MFFLLPLWGNGNILHEGIKLWLVYNKLPLRTVTFQHLKRTPPPLHGTTYQVKFHFIGKAIIGRETNYVCTCAQKKMVRKMDYCWHGSFVRTHRSERAMTRLNEKMTKQKSCIQCGHLSWFFNQKCHSIKQVWICTSQSHAT